jgi:hypothetical protein
MKYTITIIASSAAFACLSLLAAWGAAEYGVDSRREEAIFAFILIPLGGTVAGFVVGCVAAYLGHRFAVNESKKT